MHKCEVHIDRNLSGKMSAGDAGPARTAKNHQLISLSLHERHSSSMRAYSGRNGAAASAKCRTPSNFISLYLLNDHAVTTKSFALRFCHRLDENLQNWNLPENLLDVVMF